MFSDVMDFILGETPAASGLSAGGVFAINDIESEIRAWIDRNGSDGISAPSIRVNATDLSKIDAESEAVAVSTVFSLTTGSATSIGIGYARNQVGTNTVAYMNSVRLVDTAGGDIVIAATDLAHHPLRGDFRSDFGGPRN